YTPTIEIDWVLPRVDTQVNSITNINGAAAPVYFDQHQGYNVSISDLGAALASGTVTLSVTGSTWSTPMVQTFGAMGNNTTQNVQVGNGTSTGLMFCYADPLNGPFNAMTVTATVASTPAGANLPDNTPANNTLSIAVTPILNDISINSTLDNTVGVVFPGLGPNYPLKVVTRNRGARDISITDLQFQYTLNDVTAGTYYTSPVIGNPFNGTGTFPILPGNSTTLTLVSPAMPIVWHANAGYERVTPTAAFTAASGRTDQISANNSDVFNIQAPFDANIVSITRTTHVNPPGFQLPGTGENFLVQVNNAAPSGAYAFTSATLTTWVTGGAASGTIVIPWVGTENPLDAPIQFNVSGLNFAYANTENGPFGNFTINCSLVAAGLPAEVNLANNTSTRVQQKSTAPSNGDFILDDIDVTPPNGGIQNTGTGTVVPIVLRIYNHGGRNFHAYDITCNYDVNGIPVGGIQVPPSAMSPSSFTITPSTSMDITIGSASISWIAGLPLYTIDASCSFTSASFQPEDVMTNNQTSLIEAPRLNEGTTYYVGLNRDFPDVKTAFLFISGGGINSYSGLPVTFLIDKQPTPYMGQIKLYTFVNPMNSPLIVSPVSTLPEDAVWIEYQFTNNPTEDNSLFRISGVPNVTFNNLNFKVFENSPGTRGRLFYIDGSNNITFNNCYFEGIADGPPATRKTVEYALMYLNNSSKLTLNNNYFYHGSVGLFENTETHARNLSITNNQFIGQSWEGVQLDVNGHYVGNSVMFTGNTISPQGAIYPNIGILSFNSSVFTNNNITGIVGDPLGSANQAAIRVVHTAANPDSVIVTNNSITNITDASGIVLEGVTNALVQNNQNMTLTKNLAPFAIGGIKIDNTSDPNRPLSGGLLIQNNGITVNNLGTGLNLVNTSNVTLNDNVVILSNPPNQGGPNLVGISLTSAKSSKIANNRVAGYDAYGIYSINSFNNLIMYNTISMGSSSLTIGWGAGYFDFTGGTYPANTSYIWRNIIINKGIAKAMVVNTPDNRLYNANQNDFFSLASPSSGTIWASYNGNGVRVVNNIYGLDSMGTMGNWRFYANPEDGGSLYADRAFVSPTDLHFQSFYTDLYWTNTLVSILGAGIVPANLERYDADGKDRSNSGGQPVYYAGALNLTPTLSIMTQPMGINDCFGATGHDLRVAAFLTNGVPVTYQWYKDDKAMTLTDNPSFNTSILPLTPLNFNMAGIYKCVVSGIGVFPITTSTVTVEVLSPVRITKQPQTSVADLGKSVVFDVEVHAWGDTLLNDPPLFSPEFQWYKGAPPVALQDNAHYSGTKSNVLGIRNINPSDYTGPYFVTVRSHCNDVTSDTFGLSPYPGIQINTQPTNVVVCEGDMPQLTVDAQVTNGGLGLTYQWIANGVAISDGNSYQGTTTPSLTIVSATSAESGTYSCVITAHPGGKTLTTNDVYVSVKLKPTIATQPAATVALKVGAKLELVVAANGNPPLTYQWYKDNAPISTQTLATLTIDSVVINDAGNYYCIVKNDCGEVKSEQSTVAVSTLELLGVNDGSNAFALNQNNPNPFSGDSWITFTTPNTTSVRLVITDLFGREVAVVLDNTVGAGTYSVNINAESMKLSSGVYYYTLTADGFMSTKKMMVIK
ncbi:MAG: immunoglobulin domain-containing protein, partial [FCB group bacterium]